MRFLSMLTWVLFHAGFLALGFFFVDLSPALCATPEEEREAVDFEHEVWPIFVERCVRCHGPE
ncbi:MAG: hypothetical protein OSA43_12420, partial [Pirellulales bacterium]|nr:hypothetical protein [Pirellulales bacterium]